MHEAAPIVFRALQSMFGLYGTLYLVSAIYWPRWFLDTIAINYFEQRNAHRQKSRNILSYGNAWYFMPATFLTLIAVGVVIHAAAYAMIAIIPYSWGAESEDGDWESTRNWLQYAIAIVGSIGLAMRLERNAEILVWGPMEKAARHAITNAIQAARHHASGAFDVLETNIESKLAPRPNMPPSFAEDYAAGLYRAVRADIRN